MEQSYFLPVKSNSENTTTDRDVYHNKECKHRKNDLGAEH